ncbi:MAG: PQQ-binding-like beta-propeller repeat protein [Verrucomicrobia bacterium]|nr:PQQ-binding-like beta-propeller repeat protein [Verrucomicrobiota bacterium]
MKLLNICILSIVTFSLSLSASPEWPGWRGPDGNGIATADHLPAEWTVDSNIAWKLPLPAWSGSSPIISGDHIYLISPSKEEPKEQPKEEPAPKGKRWQPPAPPTNILGPGGQEILLYCVSRKDGSIQWKTLLDNGNKIQFKQNSSTPSPVTDGEKIWAVTGNGIVSAVDGSGNILWQYAIQESHWKFGIQAGYASSPILFDDLLIMQVLHGMHTDDPSYLLALDKNTGKERWYHERETDAQKESPDSYATPTLSKTRDGTHLIILGGDYVTGHNPRTGKEIWRSGGLNPKKATNYRIIPSPVAVDGMIYAPTRKKPLLALRAGGKGDVTNSHLVWKWEKPDGAPDVPTPICDGKYFYMVEDFGRVSCLDAKTGEVIWGPENTGLGRVSSSPILADGKIFITSEESETAVVQAGPIYKFLGKNNLDGSFTLSTPAAAGKQLFIRTADYLYCIAKK